MTTHFTVVSPFNKNVSSFNNEDSYPDIIFTIPGLDGDLRLHGMFLRMASATLDGLFQQQQSNACVSFDLATQTLKWIDERTKTHPIYRNVLVKWLRFCYGEDQTFDIEECPAALAVFIQLQLKTSEDLKSVIERNMVETSRNNVEAGAMLLRQCAVEYEECHCDETSRVDLELARVVLTAENIKNHLEYLIEECVVNLPPMYLDYAIFDDTTTEIHVRIMWVRYNRTRISEEEKRRILSSCNLGTINEEELKELLSLGTINLEEYREYLEGCLERRKMEIHSLERELGIFKCFCREVTCEYPEPFIANFMKVDRSAVHLFMLFGSSDNKEWVQVYRGECFEDEVGLFYFENMRKFKFYRLIFIPKSSSEHGDCQLELFSKECESGEFVEGIPVLTASSHKGYVISTSVTKGGVAEYHGHDPYNINQFERLHWHSVQNPGISSITFQLPRNRVFNALQVGCRKSGRTDQAPRSLSVQGSIDGSNWDDLFSTGSESEWRNGEKRSFTFVNNTSYLFYRLRIHTSFCIPTDYYHACHATFGNVALKRPALKHCA